jgi:ABC-type glycerol-3-phosphate transport system permease component
VLPRRGKPGKNMWGLPHVVMLENYGRAIEMGMLRYIANSAAVSVGTVVCILVAASLASSCSVSSPWSCPCRR